jgi:CRP/FNR family transcriptional regulator
MNPNELKQIYPDFEKALIEEMAAKGVVKSFSGGDYLMKTGQHFRNIILILDGIVKVYREDDEGNEFLMYYLERGQACALSMICAARFQASELMAKAEDSVQVLAIPLTKMDEWMAKYTSWYHFVLQNYRSRFEEVLNTLDHVAFRTMDERLIFHLKRYAETHGNKRFKVSITGIASELNSSREVISRLMKKLSERGWLRMEKDIVELLRLEID